MEISSQFLILVPVVVGLVEIVKSFLGLNTRYAPLFAILFGLAGTLGLPYPGIDFSAVLQGVVVGLTASGIYSATKTTLEL